ncbi:probable LRR receptor-like serine/threonine-protein kinase At3g47570 [Brassica napus]|uniref:probable LRR receptor-like serine/threonine-protein kinase At3g47570 n=1 Tax=Brassica napus TaxID=3708 RepID=UPI002078C87D|nr:probable LRR receptor-like serine/threonine-protein kinase At3g47570 [Brassica napus]
MFDFVICSSLGIPSLQNMRSMRLFLLLSFTALMLVEAYKFNDETDKQALLEFKSKVSEGRRSVLSSWNNSSPLCNWTGVKCGRKHKRVTGLDLGGLQLGGTISPSIGNLSFLTSLNLENNSFGGTIPQEVGNLFRIQHLLMSLNFLEGGIPTSLYNCSRLFEFELFSNSFTQDVPSELGSLTKLAYLELGKNNLKGKIPASLGNLTSLKYLSFGSNYIKGGIPNDISRLTQVLYLDLSMNHFSGVFPPGIYNLSLLESFNIFGNGFSGSLRPDFGNLLPNIRELYVGSNHLTGLIPTTLPNISNLQMLGMEFNSLTGSIPSSFGNVQYLQTLELNNNSLGSYSAGDLDFLGALTNCTQLDVLTVSENVLGGILPTSIANISIYVTELSLGWNLISGSIPHDIGNIINLQTLLLANNLLSGRLPASLGKLSNLGLLSVSSNRMSGEIPFSIGNITRLEKLYLDKNSFEGTIPPSLGNCSYMLRLRMDHNTLTGTIPREIMQISPLVFLTMSNNYLTGSLPKDVGSLEHLGTLSVAYNKLSGELPQTLGKCLLMEQLYLQVNSFDGTIPDISGLVGVKEVDFSNNNLSGSIPRYLANFNSLEHLNLSINNFEGKVPTEGKFKNATIVSVFGNKNLCGGVLELKLSSCLSQELEKRAKHSSLSKKVVIGVCIGGSIFIILFIASVSLCWFKNRKKNKTNAATPSTFGIFLEQISYGDLRNATDGFSSSSLIGSGSFGAVFKALLPAQNKVVAVKVLNMQRRGAMKSFMAECESLKDVRHRNLVKLLTACSSIDYQGNQFRALIYEFMPNGSLDMWLHPEEVEEIHRPSRNLTLLERLRIAIDVASVLDYLHVHCHEAIVHCDLKPSNVLLDNDLTAHVSDFGLARILLKLDQEYFLNQLSSAGVRGTIGYAAPEYGLGGQISTHGDVYSFGILVLEMFSGKRPTNEVFGENFTLCSYVKSALPERVLEVADEFILHSGLRIGFPAAKCLTLVFEVGLRCCEESPMSRLAMSEAVKELISIRESFFRSRRRAGR